MAQGIAAKTAVFACGKLLEAILFKLLSSYFAPGFLGMGNRCLRQQVQLDARHSFALGHEVTSSAGQWRLEGSLATLRWRREARERERHLGESKRFKKRT